MTIPLNNESNAGSITVMGLLLIAIHTGCPASLAAVELLDREKEGECELCQYSAPEFWVVNSRGAPRCRGFEAGFERLTYSRWDACRKVFVRESRESFLACQAELPTLLFSHGNTLTHEKALESCWKVYERIKVCPGRKLLVLWSWPAEILYKKPLLRPRKLVKDNLQAKYVYSEYQGYYIAKLVNMMSTEHPLTLSGHSYGGVTVICALHYLGGGQLNRLVLEGGAPVERPNLRAAIISGALDCDHVYPGHRYGQTFVSVETFYTTYNDRDATLKRWPTHSFRNQQAMGYVGLRAARLGPYAHKLYQHKLTEDVKRSHYMRPHLASTRMISAICRTAFESNVSYCAGSGQKGGSSAKFDMESILELPGQTVMPSLAL